MNAFIFVAVICMGTQCDFVASHKPVTLEHCQQMEKQFKQLPFRPEVTLAATQCMAFEGDTDKVKI
jgi:hypothetical protein